MNTRILNPTLNLTLDIPAANSDLEVVCQRCLECDGERVPATVDAFSEFWCEGCAYEHAANCRGCTELHPRVDLDCDGMCTECKNMDSAGSELAGIYYDAVLRGLK